MPAVSTSARPTPAAAYPLLLVALLAGCSLPVPAAAEAEAAATRPDTDSAAAVETAPAIKPYVLPTFTGVEPSINTRIAPYIPAPQINADTIFKNVLAC